MNIVLSRFVVALSLGAFVAHADTSVIGYIPKSMPRDPIAIDMFLEHAIVGQVIETLVKIDSTGDVSPNVAQKWEVRRGGLEFLFTLKEGIEFSDGTPLTADDVAYTLKRHKDSQVSQSRGYLSNIEEIQTPSRLQLLLRLKRPQVALLKILSRDHLGIVPKGWQFNIKSASPWMGSGPYRLELKSDGYYLEKNERYRHKDAVSISSWKILQTIDLAKELAELPVADVIMHVPAHVEELMVKDPRFSKHRFLRPMHFIQTSAWWYPLGKRANDEQLQARVMAALDELVLALSARNGHELSTGIIPKGIPGHLRSRRAVPMVPGDHRMETVKVSVYQNDFEPMFGNSLYEKIAEKHKLKFEVQVVGPESTDPKLTKPDVLVAAYAGGFVDPDGFMIVLTSILGQDFKTFLGPLFPLYEQAQASQDWSQRSILFQELGTQMLVKKLLVPVWKKDMFVGISPVVIDTDAVFKYSLRLNEFKRKN